MNYRTSYVAITALFVLAILIMALLINQQSQSRTSPQITADVPVEVISEELTPEKELALQQQVAPLIKAGEMSACEQVLNSTYKIVCTNNIALNKAKETNDISWCQYLDDKLISKASCEQPIILKMAVAEKDASICQKASDEKLKTQCLDSFYISRATTEQNPQVCDEDSNKDRADWCWNNFQVRQILTAQDDNGTASVCSLLRGTDVQTSCAEIFSAMEDQNTEALNLACQNQKTNLFALFCGSDVTKNLPTSLPQ